MSTPSATRAGLWFAAVLLAATAGAAACAAGVAPGIATGTLLRLQVPAPSVGETGRTVRLYLPPSYSDAASAGRRYPALYMLHGWPGSEGNMLELGHVSDTADSLIARGAIPEIIMVFPNGGGTGLFGRSYWINGYDGRKRVADFVSHDLVGWVDTHYRTRATAAGRGIIGLSEGADGAFNLAFRHPELFSACGGHSGDYVFEKGLGTSGFLGPEPGATRLLEENSVVRYVQDVVAQVKRQTLYIDCGTSDESLANSRAFHARLDSLGVRHEYHEFHGSHTWRYWSTHFRESLLAIGGALK